MQLHIFNPEHDIALATNQDKFVAPHAGREMRADMGFLPALWAEDGDLVLVHDVEAALERVRHLRAYAHEVLFVTLADLPAMPEGITVSPWGWDRALCRQLTDAGLAPALLPDEGRLADIRAMSHRRWAATHLLATLTEGHADRVGEAQYLTHISQLPQGGAPYVLKAPWSSSGRGLRYVDGITPHQEGWTRNVIARQGGVMCEPYYHKIKDFAAEFEIAADGVRYCGLSVFKAVNGAYAGNIMASEREKAEIIGQYIAFEVVEQAIADLTQLLSDQLVGRYTGPLGIDMMVVEHHGVKLHPCVEMNLRRTMGHVALSLNHADTDPRRLMQVTYEGGGYHLRIVTTAENCYPVW